MSRYEELLASKKEVSQLKAQLAMLKGEEPSPETGRQIVEIENTIARIQSFIRRKSAQYGFCA